MMQSGTELETPQSRAAAHSSNTIAQYARPEERVDFTTKSGEIATFRFMHWTPSKVFQRLPEYGSVLGVPFAMLQKAEGDERSTQEQIAQGLSVLFASLEQRDLLELMKGLLDEVYLGGENVADHFDKVFQSQPGLVIKLAAKVLDMHYSDFLSPDLKDVIFQMDRIGHLNK